MTVLITLPGRRRDNDAAAERSRQRVDGDDGVLGAVEREPSGRTIDGRWCSRLRVSRSSPVSGTGTDPPRGAEPVTSKDQQQRPRPRAAHPTGWGTRDSSTETGGRVKWRSLPQISGRY